MEDEGNGEDSDCIPSYGDLPMEIILHIFGFLNAADKKAISTTCRRWYEAFIDPIFQKGLVLKFSNIYLADNAQPISTFFHCLERPIINLYLEKVEIGSASTFFKLIGPNVEELTVDTMDINEHQMVSILKELCKLKRLTIKQCPEIFMSGQFLKSDQDKKLLSPVFKKLDTLAIMDNRYLTDSILSRIVDLTAHLRRLDLSGTPIAFHNALCKRFYPRRDYSNRSEAILTFHYVQEVVEKYYETLVELDLSHTLIGSDALYTLATMGPSWQLKKLQLKSCTQLTISLVHFLTTQRDIVYLDCSSANLVVEQWFSQVVEQLPGLRTLKLSNCKTLTDCDMVNIANLKELKQLDISFCCNLTSAGIMQGVAKEKNIVLEDLKLSGLNINEACIMQCIMNFPNLRIFDIAHCVTAATDTVVQMIAKHLTYLRELDLENCSLVTDTGLTGIECSPPAKSEQHISNEYEGLNHIMDKMTINLRSRAEAEIVADANRKRALLAIIEDANLPTAANSHYSLKCLKGLRSLNLGGCTKITDISLKYGLAFRELATLSLSNCQQISFSGIQVLLINCPSIENLYLSNCCNINNLTIELIAMKLKRLRLIDIRGCTQLNEFFINDIHFNCKALKI